MNSEHINAQHQTKRGNLPLFLFTRSVQLVARKNMPQNHRTSFRTEVKSVVHQDARYARNGKQRANFK